MLFKTQAATNYKLPTWKTPTLLVLSQFFAFLQDIEQGKQWSTFS